MMGSEGSAGQPVVGVADEKGVVTSASEELPWGTGRLSPDGKRVASDIHQTSPDTGDIWVRELERKTGIRISFEGQNASPIWTRDGRRLYWGANVAGKTGIYSAPSDGSGKAQLVLETGVMPTPGSLTPDGRTLLYTILPVGGKTEIWQVALNPSGGAVQPARVHQSPSSAESIPELSPDAKWLAYISTETGSREIYVQPFPGSGGKVRVSTQGGYGPRWSPDGHQIYYWGGVAANELTRVRVVAKPAFQVGAPELCLVWPLAVRGTLCPMANIFWWNSCRAAVPGK